MTSALDSQIDALYKLPLDEFTPARNGLAKSLSGAERKRVAALQKPSLAAWAVNQLYWNDRPTYSALIDASEQLRKAHRAVVSGKHVDVRRPEALHQAALARAAASTRKILEHHEHASPATLDAVRRMLFALPIDVLAGRFAREPQAAGFDLLMGVTPRAPAAAPKHTAAPRAPQSAEESDSRQLAQTERELKRARAAMMAQTKEAKGVDKALERLTRAEAMHHEALDKLLKSRTTLEAERAQHKRETQRLSTLIDTLEETLSKLRRE